MTTKAATILGAFLLAGLAIFGGLMKSTAETSRYELVRANDMNVLILDRRTGRCWRHFIDANGGPNIWEEMSPSPLPPASGPPQGSAR
jgi:hypothetical protein